MALSLSGTDGIVTGNIKPLNITTATIADNNVTPGKLSQKLTLATLQSATGSNTFFDFTSIPSWVKRITVMFQGVSVNTGTGITVLVQLGTGGSPTTSGYVAGNSMVLIANDTTRAIVSATTGFRAYIADDATDAITGSFVFTNINGNAWICNGSLVTIGVNNAVLNTVGSIALAGVLNMVRITTINGTATFDAGSINIMYEG